MRNFRTVFLACLVALTGCFSSQDPVHVDANDVANNGDVLNSAHQQTPPSVVKIDGLEFVLIPSGHFRMGASELQQLNQYNSCEYPAHDVTISRPFLLGRYEVTVFDFARFAADTGYRTEAEQSGLGANSLNLVDGGIQQLPHTIWSSPGFVQTDRHPVVCVSWADASAFCDWLSRKSGQVVRLPTEAEWEYACRAGTATRFNTGDLWSSLEGHGNFGDKSLQQSFPLAGGTADWNDGAVFTNAVGAFRPNQFGLYDMHGNVGEWCLDWFSSDRYTAASEVDPVGPTEATDWRAVKGGSWYNSPESCRCSGRHDGIETMASTTNGFRVLVEVDGP